MLMTVEGWTPAALKGSHHSGQSGCSAAVVTGVATKGDFFDKMAPGTMGGTYGGNAVACAAAVATIKVGSSFEPPFKCITLHILEFHYLFDLI